MAYATVLELTDRMKLTKEADEEVGTVSAGDTTPQTIELAERFLIPNAFPDSGDKDVILTVDGNVQSTTDYTVDLRNGEITYTGTDAGDASVKHKYTSIYHKVYENLLETATDRIDERTMTTFNGTTTVTETYDGNEVYDRGGTLPLFNRPVETVTQVRFNDADLGSADDFTTLTEGRADDYIVFNKVGVKFTDVTDIPLYENAVEVKYSYGYSTIPEAVKDACIVIAGRELLHTNVASQNIKGRDNFDPETTEVLKPDVTELLNRYTEQRFGEPVPTTRS